MLAIGIDMGGTTTKLGVVRDGIDIIHRDTRPTPHDAPMLAKTIGDMLKDTWKLYPDTPAAISAAGGFNEKGNFNANQLGFMDVPIRQLLRANIGFDVHIENDGTCALIAEHAQGALKGMTTAAMITLGTGIGGGVIVGGKPVRGRNAAQPELGHMITHTDGKLCSCGQVGCWEAYASATALSEMAGGMKPRDVIDAVRRGEMQDIWQEYLHEIAQGLIGICSIFYPEAIAIGGGLSNAGDLVLNGIRDTFFQSPGVMNYYSEVRIVPAHFLNDAGILGAASIAAEQ